ncbi:integrase core domain-containing protein, partial [Pseudomonas aeruginosa]|uniref:integrase core domain-containing protein n=1 Tax=Pseudomonas aeruginosa TaxID=287 RepID=UPI0021BBDF9E
GAAPTSCSGSKRRSLNSLKNCLDRWVHFIEDYIHYYNHSRIRLKLSGLSPVEYRTQARRA